jgi:hypothetical protein
MQFKLVFNLFPELLNDKWDDIEIDPVKELDGIEEPCNESECDYWSVFLHRVEGGRICIADVPTKSLAEGLADLIYNAVNHAETRLAEPK